MAKKQNKANNKTSNMHRKYSLMAVFGVFLVSVSNNLSAHSVPMSKLNEAALKVCEESVRSQACQYQGHHNDLYIGTCQYMNNDSLTCVRNKPVQQIGVDGVKLDSKH